MTLLSVVLGLATVGLIVLLVSNRSSWESERAGFRSKIDALESQLALANRLYSLQGDQYFDICRRMVNGTPEQQRSLKQAMDARDTHKGAEG